MPWAELLPWNKARTLELGQKRKLISTCPTCMERLGCPHLTPAAARHGVRAGLRADNQHTNPTRGGVGELLAESQALLPSLPLRQGRCPSTNCGQEGGDGCAVSCMVICLGTPPCSGTFANFLWNTLEASSSAFAPISPPQLLPFQSSASLGRGGKPCWGLWGYPTAWGSPTLPGSWPSH